MTCWRRDRDSNSGYLLGIHAFQACALSHSAISPAGVLDFLNLTHFMGRGVAGFAAPMVASSTAFSITPLSEGATRAADPRCNRLPRHVHWFIFRPCSLFQIKRRIERDFHLREASHPCLRSLVATCFARA